MAIASIGAAGTGGNLVAGAGTTCVVTTTAAIEAGNLGVLLIGKDNSSTTDGDNSEVSGCVDSAGNTWTKAGEHTNGNGAAAAGVTVSAWFCRLTNTLALGGTITATHASVAERAGTVWEFSCADSIVVAGTVQRNASDGVSGIGGSATISGLASANRVYIRAAGKEGNFTASISPATSGFTVIPTHRNRNNAGVCVVMGEFKVATSTGETSNPTQSQAVDAASIFFALEESAAAGGGVAKRVYAAQMI